MTRVTRGGGWPEEMRGHMWHFWPVSNLPFCAALNDLQPMYISKWPLDDWNGLWFCSFALLGQACQNEVSHAAILASLKYALLCSLEWPPEGPWRPPGDLWMTQMACNDVHLLSWVKPPFWPASNLPFAASIDLQEASKDLQVTSGWLKWPQMISTCLVGVSCWKEVSQATLLTSSKFALVCSLEWPPGSLWRLLDISRWPLDDWNGL